MWAALRCYGCGRQFEDRARFLSIESSDEGTVGWGPATDGAMGIRCPECGSERIGFAQTRPL